jgi:hypothetical protein
LLFVLVHRRWVLFASWALGSWLFIATHWMVTNCSSLETCLKSFLRWANVQADLNMWPNCLLRNTSNLPWNRWISWSILYETVLHRTFNRHMSYRVFTLVKVQNFEYLCLSHCFLYTKSACPAVIPTYFWLCRRSCYQLSHTTFLSPKVVNSKCLNSVS